MSDYSIRTGNVLLCVIDFGNETTVGFVVKVNPPRIVELSNDVIKRLQYLRSGAGSKLEIVIGIAISATTDSLGGSP